MRTTRLAAGTLLLALSLLIWPHQSFAKPPANATEYATQVRHNINDLRTLKHYAQLMDEMESIDRSLSQGTCGYTVDSISAAKNAAAKRAALKDFERCFDSALQQKPPSRALQRLGVTTYRGLNAAYRKVLKEQFNGKRINFAARSTDLEQEIINFLGKQETNVGIVVSVFKDVHVKYPWSGSWQRAREGDLVTRHTLLRTGASGRARIEFLDRFIERNSGPSVLAVHSNTQIEFVNFDINWEREEPKKGLIELLQGAVRLFSKGWGGRAAFSVRTGTSLCGIRGTDIEIHYDPNEDRTYYMLYEGVVEISTPYERFVLKPGTSVTVTRGQRSEIMRIAPPS